MSNSQADTLTDGQTDRPTKTWNRVFRYLEALKREKTPNLGGEGIKNYKSNTFVEGHKSGWSKLPKILNARGISILHRIFNKIYRVSTLPNC